MEAVPAGWNIITVTARATHLWVGAFEYAPRGTRQHDAVTATQSGHAIVADSAFILVIALQAYVENSVAVEPELLSEVQGFLQLLANVDSDDTAAVVLELRKCCGSSLKWARRCAQAVCTMIVDILCGGLRHWALPSLPPLADHGSPTGIRNFTTSITV